MNSVVGRNSSYLNGKSTTGTLTRVQDRSCTSGMCPICIDDCPVLCEIGLAALRGREALYPDPMKFGHSTAGALKDFGLDWSHFNIHSELLGAEGIESNSDLALFPNVNIESNVGGIPLKMPLLIGAYGSTDIARIYWKGLATGAAISGIIITVGENVCAMDPEAKMENGKISYSQELKRRVDSFREFWDGKYGDIAVQTNVEDQRLGVDTYAASKLEVNTIERKWGQGAKAIGGEVRITDHQRALRLKKAGYLVIPDPEEPGVEEAFRDGMIQSFERHSRVGMLSEKNFLEDIDNLRSQGVKRVSLKTGAYRPSAVALTMKLASAAKLSYVTFDGAGGGTGMSPVPMMDEMGTPTVYLEAHVLKCAEILRKKGRYVPDIVIAGGFIEETQIYKSIAMSNFGEGPYVKAALLGRAPITAVNKTAYFAKLAENGQLPKAFVERYGVSPRTFLASTGELQSLLGNRFDKLPLEAVGLYGYMRGRIGVGLQQLMAGSRKWNLKFLHRKDLLALTERAAVATGIPLPEDCGMDAIENILS